MARLLRNREQVGSRFSSHGVRGWAPGEVAGGPSELVPGQMHGMERMTKLHPQRKRKENHSPMYSYSLEYSPGEGISDANPGRGD